MNALAFPSTRWLVLVVTLCAVPVLALAAAAVAARLFVVDNYRVHGAGMSPSMGAGAYALAWRRSYRSASEVERGQIIVISEVRDGRRYTFLWRVIGLPGDTVRTGGRGVWVNGQLLPQHPIKELAGQRIAREALADRSYLVAYDLGDEREPSPPVAIPPGHLFLMGDNRSHSFDSEDKGAVAFHQVRGRVFWSSAEPLSLLP